MRHSFTLFGLLLCLVPASLPAQTVSNYVPLTGPERWTRYWNESFLSPGLYFAALGAASGAQLGNDPPEWGQGLRGYGRRSASLFGTFAVQTTIEEGGSALMGYDPRYRHCDCQGFWKRSGHAVKWTFLTSDNQGRTRPNIPMVAGAYGSGMVTTLWYPDRYNPLKDGVREGTQQLGFGVGVSLVKEFAPELKRFFRWKR